MTVQAIVKQMLLTIPPGVSLDHATGVAEAYLASLRHKDPVARGRLFAETAVFEDPVGGKALRGKAELEAFWRSFDGSPMQLDPTLDRIVLCGNEALMIFRLRMSLPGMGTAEMQIYETLVFDADGKIAQGRAYWDERCVS
jgi:steroid delta-isomerase